MDDLVANPIDFASHSQIEADEMLIKHVLDKEKGGYSPVWIMSILERESGKLVLKRVSNRSTKHLLGVLIPLIAPSNLVYTDDWASYRTLESLGYRHFSVTHSRLEYSRDEIIDGVERHVHINTLEGVHHHIRRRLSNKSNRDFERIDLIIHEIMYRHSKRDPLAPFKV